MELFSHKPLGKSASNEMKRNTSYFLNGISIVCVGIPFSGLLLRLLRDDARSDSFGAAYSRLSAFLETDAGTYCVVLAVVAILFRASAWRTIAGIED